MGRAATLLAVVVSALHAQSVDGTLADSVSRAPIPGVIVTLLGPERYDGTTDQTGAFHISPVRPGKYMLNIVQAGYTLPASRRSFQVDSDTRISIEMEPLGTIEGRVRYPDGRPAPRAPVWLRPYPTGAQRTGTADAGGRFVFDDLAPGKYAIAATGAAGDPKPEGEIWAVTYFPSTTDHDAAEPILVTTGPAVSRDIRLRSVPQRHVRGIVRDETGRPAAATVTLRPAVEGQERTAQTGDDGQLDFQPWDGDWRLTGTRADGDIERRGTLNFTVSRHDVENAEVRLALPFSIPTVTDRDDPPAPGARQFPAMAVLFALDGSVQLRTSGDAFTNVYPGRYLIHAMNMTPGVYVESIKLGEAEVDGQPVDIWDGSVPIRVTYRNGGAVVRGTVENGDGTTVAIVNADESLPAGGVGTVAMGAGGRFEFNTLRPGDYYIFVHGANAPLRPVPPGARKLHLEKGSTTFVQFGDKDRP
jgi:hypothetical protein